MIQNDTNPRVATEESEAAGAPACEIEITPEMVEAGKGVLLAADYRLERHEDVVREILETTLKISQLAS